MEVEIVYVALLNTLHYESTVKALNAGKHVLCEKPLVSTAEQAKRMFATAEQNRVYLMEAFAYQHSPYISEVRNEIRRGIIGKIRYMESAYLTSDYEKSNIRMRKEMLGDCTYDLGVYNISLLLRMMGEKPVRISAVGSFSEEGIDKLTPVIMEYADGKKQISFAE